MIKQFVFLNGVDVAVLIEFVFVDAQLVQNVLRVLFELFVIHVNFLGL
jgi:hypothetical protein